MRIRAEHLGLVVETRRPPAAGFDVGVNCKPPSPLAPLALPIDLDSLRADAPVVIVLELAWTPLLAAAQPRGASGSNDCCGR